VVLLWHEEKARTHPTTGDSVSGFLARWTPRKCNVASRGQSTPNSMARLML
jgi:hypothetical protein